MPASYPNASLDISTPKTFKSPLQKTYHLAFCFFIHTPSRFKIPSKEHSLSLAATQPPAWYCAPGLRFFKAS